MVESTGAKRVKQYQMKQTYDYTYCWFLYQGHPLVTWKTAATAPIAKYARAALDPDPQPPTRHLQGPAPAYTASHEL